jgi:probable rRNA maturation factor
VGAAIEYLGSHRLSPADVAWLSGAVDAVAARLPQPVARAAVELVDDGRMSALHARFMNDPSTTDVLTFAQNEPGAPVDCDVAVCVDEAARRGAGRPHGTREELLLYVLHALLHACGFDDRDPASHAAMHAEEDRILVACGFGPLFAAGEGRG